MQLKARVVLYDREYGRSSGYRGSADVELTERRSEYYVLRDLPRAPVGS